MTLWNYIAVGLSVALLIFCLIMEVRRAGRKRLPVRIGATVLAVLSMTCLVAPFSCHSVRHAAIGHREEAGVLPVSSGVASVYWDRKALPGERWRIQGRFNNTTGKIVRLELRGTGVLLDSAAVGAAGGDFELATKPAQRGRALYQLIALSGKDTLEKEVIPLEVLPERSLRILILAAAPGFENRFLVDWLSERGQVVAARTVISKDKYDRAYIHMGVVPLDILSPSLLDKFEVVITDAVEMETIGAGQRAMLARQVAEKGMGLVIRDSMAVGVGAQVLKRDSLLRPLISRRLYGEGKIVYTKLESTWSLVLSGERQQYADLWVTVLRGAVGEAEKKEDWLLAPELPRVNDPATFFLRTNNKEMPAGAVEGKGGRAVVYMDQHPFLTACWEGTYWPADDGWHTVGTPRGDSSWWYVWKESDWKGVYGKYGGTGGEMVAMKVSGGMEKDWYEVGCWLIFLLSMIFLWVERKL